MGGIGRLHTPTVEQLDAFYPVLAERSAVEGEHQWPHGLCEAAQSA